MNRTPPPTWADGTDAPHIETPLFLPDGGVSRLCIVSEAECTADRF